MFEKNVDKLIDASLKDIKKVVSEFETNYDPFKIGSTSPTFIHEKELAGTLIAHSMLNLMEPLKKLQERLKTEQIIELDGAELKITPSKNVVDLYDVGEAIISIDVFVRDRKNPDYTVQYNKKDMKDASGVSYTASVHAVETNEDKRIYRRVSLSNIYETLGSDIYVINISNDLESTCDFFEVCDVFRDFVSSKDIKKATPMTALFSAYDIVKEDGGLFGGLSTEIVNEARQLLYPKIVDKLLEHAHKNMEILEDNGFIFMEKSLINERDDRTSFMIPNPHDFKNCKMSYHHHQTSLRPYNGIITIIEKDKNDQDAYFKLVPVHHKAIFSEEYPDLVFSDKTSIFSYDIQKKEVVFYDDSFADILTVVCQNAITEDKMLALWDKKRSSKFETDNFDLFIPLDARKEFDF